MPDRTGGPRKREYPPIYEKVIPIALGILAALIVVLLLVIVAVLTGLLPYRG